MSAFARLSLDCSISQGLKYNFILAGIPHPIHVIHFRRVRLHRRSARLECKQGMLAGEAEEGEEASSRDCAG